MKRIVTATLARFSLHRGPSGPLHQTSTLKVPGMTCPTCPITVKKSPAKG